MAARQNVTSKCVLCSVSLSVKGLKVSCLNCSSCGGAICKGCIFGDCKSGKQSDTKTTEYLNAISNAKLKVSVECGKCKSFLSQCPPLMTR